MGNDTQYGLAAYFFSKDLKRVWNVASELEYGARWWSCKLHCRLHCVSVAH